MPEAPARPNTPLSLIELACARLEGREPWIVRAIADGDLDGDGIEAVYAGLQYAATKGRLKLPAAVVVPVSDDAGASVAPRVGTPGLARLRIGVLHVVPARNDPSGRRTTRDALDEALATTRYMLEGWHPRPRPSDALAFRRGRLLELDDGRAAWMDEYEAEWWPVGHPAHKFRPLAGEETTT